MAVMNCVTPIEKNEFAQQEILAARNAFLQYNEQKQAELLVVMPINEAVAVLSECSINHVQALLDQLDTMGEEVRKRHFAHGLGLICSEVETTEDYLTTSVLAHVKQRIGWIIGLALLGIVSGLIIASYEDTLAQLVLLAIYMPVIAAAGGNTGSQAATLVIRALAMGELKKRQWLDVMWKEFRVSLFIAASISCVVMIRIFYFSGDTSTGGFALNSIALAIGVALSIQVILSTTLGGLLPIIARALKLDPAVLVSPVLASVVDISGMLIYFSTVNYYLGLS
ncbi:magnesium transporter [Vibrio sp. Of7-15]|uniref:magnesium transporter n=1 Tax=Vibrio sp. Of7-15 TaxID=2724879 RepID=UPI001EF330BC|nr:magnesium transporter [Vibrio sp. Of7-15]MCG7497566.1 magnesium transporter [Vibrio sp. Of7-15]